MAVILVMIACTFCAGCTDNEGGEIPSIGTNAEQKEFDEWMKIVENPPSGYTIDAGKLKHFRMLRPGNNWLYIDFLLDTGAPKLLPAVLGSSNLVSINNGAKLDDISGKNIFIVKDNSLSTSTVTVLLQSNSNKVEFAVLHLTFEDYNALTKTINDWFKEYPNEQI